MTKPKVIMLKGLPGSGKTQWARDYVDTHNGKVKRINKDDLRAMMDNGKWHWENEKFVLNCRDQLIMRALMEGKDVIVDDTNLNPKMERGIRTLVGPSVTVEVMFFDVDVKECIERDSKREGTAHVGEDVIMGMYNKWEGGWKDADCSIHRADLKEKYQRDPSLPRCIIVDIDGTLAYKGDRGWYDWNKVDCDTVVEPVAELVRRYYYDLGYVVMIFSGRDGSCKEMTQQWLWDNEIPYNEFHMRKAGDTRNDSIVKTELFDQHVNGLYSVEFVIDDRLSVIQTWVERGLFVMNVNQHMDVF